MRFIFLFFLSVLVYSCTTTTPGLFINEITCSSSYGYIDTISKKPIDWIELYNGYKKDVNLTGYSLKYVKKTDTTTWAFPEGTIIKSKDYLLLNADELDSAFHTNFKLSSKSGFISLLNTSNNIIDEVNYDKQEVNISLGRKTDGDSIWVYFDNPTPNSSNNQSYGAAKNKRSKPPVFETTGGFYDDVVKVKIKHNKKATIFYTTNGDTPTSNSTKYSSKIKLTKTTVIKAIAVEEDKVASIPTTNTYFINVKKELPVISLSADQHSLWDTATGIYKLSLRGIERFGNIEFYNNQKQQVINQAIDIKISGNVARAHGLKAFQLIANDEYGKDNFNYKIFPEKNIDKYNTLLLRGGGHPDKYYTTFRDGMSQYLTNEYFHIDHSGYRACVVYLNGEYWGIYNIREKGNERFIADNHNIKPKDFSMLQKSWSLIRSGNKKHYVAMKKFLDKCDKSDPKNYSKVKSMMDVDNFINYTIAETYCANVDWPHWNIKYWRLNNDTAKWRWILNDLDFGTGAGKNFKFNMIEFITSPVKTRSTNPPKATKIFRDLFEFKQFREEYIQRLAVSINEIYSYERICKFVDKFAGEKRSEIPHHIKRWAYSEYESPWNMTFRIFQSVEEWETKVEKIKKFAKARPYYMKKNTIKKFNLDGEVKVTTIAENGEIVLNTIPIKKDSTDGIYFKNVPFRLSCNAKPGFEFDYWSINNKHVYDEHITYTPATTTVIKAVMKPNNEKVFTSNTSL